MTETSVQAYDSVQEALGLRQRQVMVELCKADLTNFQIAKQLSLPINQITPRVYELRQRGLVIAKGFVVCPETGRRAILWGIPLDNGQRDFFLPRK